MTSIIKAGSLGKSDSFNFAVEEIYQCAHTPGHWPMALHAIVTHFGDVGASLTFRAESGAFNAIVSPGLQPSLKDYQEYWWQHDIRGRGWAGGMLLPDVVTDRHVVTQEEIDTHPFYTDFLVPNGLGWSVGTTIAPLPDRIVLSLQRGKVKGPYSDDELVVFGRLGRHAERSLRLGIRLLNAELANSTFADALARLNVAVFLLDEEGRVEFTNPLAERLVGDGLAVVNRRLVVQAREERTRFNTALTTLLDATPGAAAEDIPPILVHRTSSERPLALYLLPVRIGPEQVAERLLSCARAVVMAIDPRTDEPADPALVRDLLGVTLGEARIAALVGAGKPPREAAETLGISEATVRTTLKRVFAKTGISRQSELSALLTRLVLR